jgi:integrase
MPKLTKRVIDDLKPRPGKPETYAWDTELKGFGVRLMQGGLGTYIVKYRNTEGRQRKLALGRVGALTPDQARTLAKQRLAEVAKGSDPSAERRAIRAGITVAELCDLYVADAAPRVKASTLAMDRSRIEAHVKPLLGRYTVAALTSDDIAAFQTAVLAGKTAKPRKGRGGVTTGGRGAAARTVGMLGTILELAKRRKIIRENPARTVEKLPEGQQRRFLSLAEIGQLGEAMRTAEDEPTTGIAAIKLLLLTGCRRMEVLALHWACVDAKAKCIRFADTKSGAQVRPIGAAALDLLATLPRREGCAYVLPAERGDGHFVGVPRMLARLCAQANLDGVTTHVLRHSFAAAAAEMGFSELTIAGMLGHTVSGVTARYAHVPDSALVAAADRVSMRIAAALDGSEHQAVVLRFGAVR